MDLREYLFKHKMKQADFARELCVTPSYICKVVAGKHIPGKHMAQLIAFITHGEVVYEKQLKKEGTYDITREKKFEVQNATSEREESESDKTEYRNRDENGSQASETGCSHCSKCS